MNPQPEARIAVIIPALNEQEAIGRVIGDLPDSLIREIIVVDNGSTDDTAGCAHAAGARVVREERRGYGQACLTGIAALSDEIQIVAFIDG
ncbi:MAG: glycosyltransferase, partial [Gemmatimonadetes bacterium]|nr:glycosyltransferase [Gemmatimonadota bacterium]